MLPVLLAVTTVLSTSLGGLVAFDLLPEVYELGIDAEFLGPPQQCRPSWRASCPLATVGGVAFIGTVVALS
jgi:hypothetical protein